MPTRFPKYTSKDMAIMVAMLIPATVVINTLMFGKKYYTQFDIFLPATVVSFVIMAASWQLHTMVAVILRLRFPSEKQVSKRIAIAIFLFILMTSLTTTLLFYGYDYIQFLNYKLNERMYLWALAIGVIQNVFITFLHEGVSSFEKWRATLKETEQLKKVYLHGQLLGLKSQVNPHFLFNSLNSLSSLISEDQAKAEKFLDEMSKVYRYLLRNNDDKLIELEKELQFLHSYTHLLNARYGNGVQVTINVSAAFRNKMLPPLTLQILLESTLNLNRINKDEPLKIEIEVNASGRLQLKNNVQKKIRKELKEDDSGLENINNKFNLLCQQSIRVHESLTERIIEVPLIQHLEAEAI